MLLGVGEIWFCVFRFVSVLGFRSTCGFAAGLWDCLTSGLFQKHLDWSSGLVDDDGASTLN